MLSPVPQFVLNLVEKLVRVGVGVGTSHHENPLEAPQRQQPAKHYQRANHNVHLLSNHHHPHTLHWRAEGNCFPSCAELVRQTAIFRNAMRNKSTDSTTSQTATMNTDSCGAVLKGFTTHTPLHITHRAVTSPLLTDTSKREHPHLSPAYLPRMPGHGSCR